MPPKGPTSMCTQRAGQANSHGQCTCMAWVHDPCAQLGRTVGQHAYPCTWPAAQCSGQNLGLIDKRAHASQLGPCDPILRSPWLRGATACQPCQQVTHANSSTASSHASTCHLHSLGHAQHDTKPVHTTTMASQGHAYHSTTKTCQPYSHTPRPCHRPSQATQWPIHGMVHYLHPVQHLTCIGPFSHLPVECFV